MAGDLPEVIDFQGTQWVRMDVVRGIEAKRATAAGATGHCADCCCARAWAALGITSYTGKSIPEEIERLLALLTKAQAALTRIKHFAVGKCDMTSKTRLACINRECEAEAAKAAGGGE